MKILPVGAELFHVKRQTDGQADGREDGQTDMTKLIIAFCNFANSPKKKADLQKNQKTSEKNGSWTKSYFYFMWANGSFRSSTRVPNAVRTITKYTCTRRSRTKQCETEFVTFVLTVRVVRNASWIVQWTVANTVELHPSGLIRTASHPDMQKIRIIGFLF